MGRQRPRNGDRNPSSGSKRSCRIKSSTMLLAAIACMCCLLHHSHAIPSADRLLPFIENSSASNWRQRRAGTSFSTAPQPIRTASESRAEMVWELEIKTVPEMVWHKTQNSPEKSNKWLQKLEADFQSKLVKTFGQNSGPLFRSKLRSKLKDPNPIPLRVLDKARVLDKKLRSREPSLRAAPCTKPVLDKAKI